MSLQTVVTPQGNVEIRVDGLARPSQILQAAREQRSELRNQLERLEERRSDLRQELTETPSSETVARQGLEARIGGLHEDLGLVACGPQYALDAEHLVADRVAIPQRGEHLVDSNHAHLRPSD